MEAGKKDEQELLCPLGSGQQYSRLSATFSFNSSHCSSTGTDQRFGAKAVVCFSGIEAESSISQLPADQAPVARNASEPAAWLAKRQYRYGQLLSLYNMRGQLPGHCSTE
jgi:hypothetical protein